MKLHSLGRIFSLVALLTLVFALTFAVSVTANAEGEAQSEIKITVIRDENDNFAKTEPALTSAEGKVKLDWAKVDGAAKYLIYKNGEHIVNSLSDHYVASGLTIGQNVTFTVHAVNASGKVLATGTVEFAADHSWNITTVDPTCVLDGSMKYDCKHCDATKTETLTKLGHLDDIPHAAVSPTCTETGLTAGVQCSRCNVMTTPQQVVAANGHTEVVDAAVAPTCTETGLTAGKHCSVCNTTLVAQNVVPALGHTAGTPVKENNVDPTCTTAGGYDMATYCTVCEAETSRVHTDLAALGHKGGTATCTDKAVCEVCSVPYGDLRPHTNATPVVENRTEPDCVTVGGYDTVVYCTECNAELSRVHTELAALGHTNGAPKKENNVAPTCTTKGGYDMATYCTVCKVETSRVHTELAALGHNPGAAATCTTDQNCQTCNAVLEAAHGHDFYPNDDPKAVIVKQICKTCGTEGEFVKIQFPPAYKVPAIVGGCVAVIIFCLIALTRPATTTPWWKRRRR